MWILIVELRQYYHIFSTMGFPIMLCQHIFIELYSRASAAMTLSQGILRLHTMTSINPPMCQQGFADLGFADKGSNKYRQQY